MPTPGWTVVGTGHVDEEAPTRVRVPAPLPIQTRSPYRHGDGPIREISPLKRPRQGAVDGAAVAREGREIAPFMLQDDEGHGPRTIELGRIGTVGIARREGEQTQEEWQRGSGDHGRGLTDGRMDLRANIEALAQTLGFATLRVASFTSPTPGIDVYDAWIGRGHHGHMDYLSRGRDPRADARERLSSARSALVLSWDHATGRPPDPGGRTGKVARYAWGRDYHNLVGKRLRNLRRRLREQGVQSWGGVDAAPILERSWARLAGLGFLGKNTMSIVPSRGSYYFLAVLFIDAELRPDTPTLRDFCGKCTRCLIACPTQAFPAPFSLDATRCISYWTIEAPGLPPPQLRRGFGRWFFGCDVCQEVCPHNHRPEDRAHPDLAPRNAWIDLDEILLTPDEALMERFIGTPLRRPGGAGLKRNALLVLANLGDRGGVEAASHALAHPSPVVRASAVWCLRQLDAEDRLPDSDPDPLVVEELGRS